MPRGVIEQIYAIMKAIQYKPLKLSHILYKTRSNCTVLKRHLEQLMEKGYVEKIDPYIKSQGSKIGKSHKQYRYRVTDKGRQFLKAMEIVSQVYS